MFYQSIKHRKSMLYCFFATLPLYHKANEKAYVMYYTVINTALQAFENTQLVFSTFPLCTQMPIMLLSQCNIGLYLLHTLFQSLQLKLTKIEVIKYQRSKRNILKCHNDQKIISFFPFFLQVISFFPSG